MKKNLQKLLSRSLLSFVFTMTFFLSISFVLACINPTIYNEHGVPINPFGGAGLTIDGREYSEMQIDFPISVRNKNDQGLTVTLRPYSGLRDYIDDAIIYLQADETAPLDLRTWIGGQSYMGIIQVYYTCDDGGPQYFFPIVNVYIVGQKLEPPPNSTCDSHDLDGCYGGMKRDYYCSHNELTYSKTCTETCCENFGGEGSFCSSDRQTCLTWDTLPPGTEGNIAFICKDSTCRVNNERHLMFMFRTHGWNVTALPYYAWTESEIESHDIIVCSDQRKACNFDFNSLLYDQHTNDMKPFLEIPDKRSIYAADTFEYTTSSRASTKSDSPYVNSIDYITDGYSGVVQTVTGADRYVTVKDSYLTSAAKDLIDVDDGDEDSSVMFKVKEDVDHGRYAFIGWLYDSTALTTDGSILLNRTLKWLKEGDAGFGGDNIEPVIKGDIAFICQKNACGRDNEKELIKYLRKNEYSIIGKEGDSWALDELNEYDLIICSDSKTCDIDEDSAIYSAHKNNGQAFLEIPYKGGVDAAEVFGYVNSKSYRKSGYAIIPQGADEIFSGFNGYMEVLSEKNSIYGPKANALNPAKNLAEVPDSEISTMFVSDASGDKGRYAYVGWMPNVNELNENGEKLLIRTIEWLICGDGCLESFNSAFGDMTLSYEVTAPLEQDYDSRRLYLEISSNQRVKEITYSINGGRERRVCKDCKDVDKRLRVDEGENELNITLLDHTGTVHKGTIEFFVDSKKPKISRIYPRSRYIEPIETFEIKYTEDNLESIEFYWKESSAETFNEVELQGCQSGRYQYCSTEVDLSAFIGQEIEYYFVIEDRTHTKVSRTYDADVEVE